MELQIQPMEKLLFLKSKQTLLFNNMHAYLFRLKYTYSTNRNNKKCRTRDVIYFYPMGQLNALVNKIKMQAKDLLLKDIELFNEKYPFRKINDINIESIDLLDKTKVEFNKGKIEISLKEDLIDDSLKPLNNLTIHEAVYQYEKKGKIQESIIYALDCEEKRDGIKGYVSYCLNPKTQEMKMSDKNGRSSKQIKISNVKILDVLKTVKVSIG